MVDLRALALGCFFFFLILPHISFLPAAEVTHEEPGGQVWPQVTAVELLSYGAITVCQDCFMYLLLLHHFTYTKPCEVGTQKHLPAKVTSRVRGAEAQHAELASYTRPSRS